MSNITFLQYNPNKEKKRPNNSSGACINCRKAHAACNTWRPCDRCVRMQCECKISEKKTKKDTNSPITNSNDFVDVDTVSKLLFDANPTTPAFDPYSLPSPLSTYVNQPLDTPLADFPIPTPISFSSTPQFTPPNVYETQQQSPNYPEDLSPPNINTNMSDMGVVANTDTQDKKIDDLIAQNARMEKLLSALSLKVDHLETQISTAVSKSYMAPATASWRLPSCELLECNQNFLDLLGYTAGEDTLSTFFQLGACTDAMGKIRQRIEHATKHNEPISDPTYSRTLLVVPMFKKTREVVLLNISVVICLDAPVPVMTTVLHKLPNMPRGVSGDAPQMCKAVPRIEDA